MDLKIDEEIPSRDSFIRSLNFDNTLISSMISELNNTTISDTSVFYNKCVIDRLDKCSDVYLKELDKDFDALENDMSNFDLRRFNRLLSNMSKASCKFYEASIRILKKLCGS